MPEKKGEENKGFKIKYIGVSKSVINKFGTFEKGKETEVGSKAATILSKSTEFELVGEKKLEEKADKVGDK